MFCNQCGSQLADGSKFCNVCGAKQIVYDSAPQQIEQGHAQQDYGPTQAYGNQGYEQPYVDQGYEQQQNYGQAQQGYGQPYNNQEQYGQPYYEQQPMPGQNLEQQSMPNRSFEQQPMYNQAAPVQPAPARPDKPAKQPKPKSGKKKLPTWAKVCIIVGVLAIVATAAIVTVIAVKKKKDASGTFVKINGVRCDIDEDYGLKDLEKVEDGIVYAQMLAKPGEAAKIYKGGVFLYDVSVSRYNPTGVAIDRENRPIGCIMVSITARATVENSNGTMNNKSKGELAKAGYAQHSIYTYSKLYDKDGEIPLSRIDADYDKLLSEGAEGIPYFLSGFPEDRISINSLILPQRSKEENRQAVKEYYEEHSGLDLDDYESYLKFSLLLSSELHKLTGMNKEYDYEGATSDFLVLENINFGNGRYIGTELIIYAPVDKLNAYMGQWGMAKETFFDTSVAVPTDTAEVTEAVTETTEETTEATTEETASDEPIHVYIRYSDASFDNYMEVFYQKYPEYRDKVIIDSLDVDYDEYVDEVNKGLASSEAPSIVLYDLDYANELSDTDKYCSMDEIGFTEAELSDMYPYTKDLVTYNGKLMGVSPQICPGGFMYSADKANEVFGTSDPEVIGQYFTSWDGVLEAAALLKSYGYYLVPETDCVARCMGSNYDQSVIDAMISNGYSKEVMSWTEDWNKSMREDSFGIFGCSWFIYSFGNDWSAGEPYPMPVGVCVTPNAYYWGGSVFGVTKACPNKDLAKLFLYEMCCDPDVISLTFDHADVDWLPNSMSIISSKAESGEYPPRWNVQNAELVTNSLRIYDEMARKIGQ